MTTQNSSNQIFILNADGYSLGGGGTTTRTFSITGGDITLSSSGTNTFTTPASTSTLASLELSETFSALKTFSSGLTVSAGIITFSASSAANASIKCTGTDAIQLP